MFTQLPSVNIMKDSWLPFISWLHFILFELQYCSIFNYPALQSSYCQRNHIQKFISLDSINPMVWTFLNLLPCSNEFHLPNTKQNLCFTTSLTYNQTNLNHKREPSLVVDWIGSAAKRLVSGYLGRIPFWSQGTTWVITHLMSPMELIRFLSPSPFSCDKLSALEASRFLVSTPVLQRKPITLLLFAIGIMEFPSFFCDLSIRPWHNVLWLTRP